MNSIFQFESMYHESDFVATIRANDHEVVFSAENCPNVSILIEDLKDFNDAIHFAFFSMDRMQNDPYDNTIPYENIKLTVGDKTVTFDFKEVSIWEDGDVIFKIPMIDVLDVFDLLTTLVP